MFKSLFRKAASPSQAPRVPDEVRVYAIGDIHGCADLLDDLLRRIAADHAARPAKRLVVVLVGDLVDRGPDSAGVIERAMALKADDGDVRIIAGNHEELFLKTLAGDRESTRLFTKVGGRETLLSYGIAEDIVDFADFDTLSAEMHARVPAAHIAFLKSLEDVVEIGDYAFVHAGIRPGVPLDEQVPAHLRWIRGEFLEFRGNHPRFIIHGHTITEAVDERANRIGIDTGAYATARLTAIGLDGTDRWYVATA